MYSCFHVWTDSTEGFYREMSFLSLIFLLQHLSTTEVKVGQVQVNAASSSTFAVCLDQDEKKVLQSVTR